MMRRMQPCAFANLMTGGALVLLAAFSGCVKEPTGMSETTPGNAPTSAGAATRVPDGPADDAPADDGESGDDEASDDGSGDEGESDEGESDEGERAGATDTSAAKPSKRDPADIAKVVKANRAAIRKCYEAALKEIPGLKGDMVIKFVIRPSGEVKQAELNIKESTIRSPQVVDCSIEVIKKLKFKPHPTGMDTTTNYPFNLNP